MLKQRLQHKLLQKLSPQQIQLMKLLQVPTVELEQRIKEEIEENPALEEGAEVDEAQNDLENDDKFEGDDSDSRDSDDFDINDYLDDDIPAYRTHSNNTTSEDDEKAIPLSGGKTFQELLDDQIGLRIADNKELLIAKTIIGNLDDGGYLRREIINLVDDLAFSQNIICDEQEVEAVLAKVQNLEPAGVGARSIKECLLIQLRRKEKMTIEQKTAEVVLEKHFDEFTKKHYSKIVKKLEIESDDLKDAVEEIIKLNPKPGNSLRATSHSIHQIIPDFIIREDDGELSLSLNSRNAPQLKVSRGYSEMLETYAASQKTKKDKEAIMFVKQKIDSAKWFIDAIKQRQQTLLVTMEAIMNYQREFFLSGDETSLKPMILKDIAEIVELDISTISRVANSKHAQTPYGTYLLKYFFSESLSTDSGEEVSTREVKKILQDAVDGEIKNKPLTDEKLATLLKNKGYNIARRTVAKYREQLNIPVARLRKEL